MPPMIRGYAATAFRKRMIQVCNLSLPQDAEPRARFRFFADLKFCDRDRSGL